MGALTGQILYAAIAFVGSVLAARLLGVAGKGEYTAWTLAAAFAALILAGPIPVGLGRLYLSGRPARLVGVVIRHTLLALAVIVPATAVGIAAGGSVIPFATCVLVAIPTGVLIYDVLIVMQAAKRPWFFNGIRILQAAVVTVGFIVLTVATPAAPLDWAFGFLALGSVAAAGLALFVCWLRRRDSGTTPTLSSVAERGAGSTGANAIDFLTLRADQFVVIAVTGATGLGIYGVAVNWSEIGLYLGHAIGQASFEDRDTLDKDAGTRILRRTGRLLFVATVVLVASGWFLIPPLFGDEFSDARWVLLWLAPGIVARSVGYTSGQILLARGEGRFVTSVLGLTVAGGLCAWFLVTGTLGIRAAAAVSSGVYIVQMILLRRRVVSS